MPNNWADLGEDKMIDPAPGFWPIFGPLRPPAGSGSPGNGPGSKIVRVAPKSTPETNSKPAATISGGFWGFPGSGPA